MKRNLKKVMHHEKSKLLRPAHVPRKSGHQATVVRIKWLRVKNEKKKEGKRKRKKNCNTKELHILNSIPQFDEILNYVHAYSILFDWVCQ